MSNHPPKPRLALSIGVIGHRPRRLPPDAAALQAVEAAVANVVSEVVKAGRRMYEADQAKKADERVFANESPLFSVVSALADGADTMVARIALNREAKDFVLDVPLPFAQSTYEHDFSTDASRSELRDLLGRARSVLELPGSRDAESRAYETVGLTVLGQSDIVLVIWDGGPSAGRGGTTEMIQTAIRAGLPIVHVDAKGEAPTKVIWQGLAPLSVAVEAIEELPATDLTGLPDIVGALVRPPSSQSEAQNLARYLGEARDRRRMRIEFPLLQALARVRPLRGTDRESPDPDTLATAFAATAAPAAKSEQVSVLAGAYGWSDALGVRFAQTFRGAFIMNFLLAAFAVVLAALSLIFYPKWPLVLAEVLCILAILVNTLIGHQRDWHRRWVEPRELAERLRVALPLWALGTRPIGFPGEEPSWTGWYACDRPAAGAAIGIARRS